MCAQWDAQRAWRHGCARGNADALNIEGPLLVDAHDCVVTREEGCPQLQTPTWIHIVHLRTSDERVIGFYHCGGYCAHNTHAAPCVGYRSSLMESFSRTLLHPFNVEPIHGPVSPGAGVRLRHLTRPLSAMRSTLHRCFTEFLPQYLPNYSHRMHFPLV